MRNVSETVRSNFHEKRETQGSEGKARREKCARCLNHVCAARNVPRGHGLRFARRHVPGSVFTSLGAVEKDFIAQSGDPTNTGQGGECIYSLLDKTKKRGEKKFFKDEIFDHMKHKITLRSDLDFLDGKYTIFGELAEVRREMCQSLRVANGLSRQIATDEQSVSFLMRSCTQESANHAIPTGFMQMKLLTGTWHGAGGGSSRAHELS
eukprot:3122180-Rhodomonas_salina.1